MGSEVKKPTKNEIKSKNYKFDKRKIYINILKQEQINAMLITNILKFI